MAVHSYRYIEFISRMEDRVLAEGITDWLNRDIKTSTVHNCERAVISLLEFAEGYLRKNPWRRDINRRLVKAWIAHRRERASRSTVQKDWTTVKSLFHYLSSGPDKIWQENPVSGVEINRKNTSPRPMPCLTPDQVRDLTAYLKMEKEKLDKPGSRIRYRQACQNELIISLFLGTGITRQVFIDLKIKHFRKVSGKYYLQTYRTKTDHPDLPQLDERTGKLLESYLKMYRTFSGPEDPLITRKDKKAYGDTEISDQVAAVIKKSGVTPEKMCTHGLRASHALMLFMGGHPVSVIQRKLGHKDIRTTTIYLNRAMEVISSADTTVNLENPVISEYFKRLVNESRI